MSEPKPDEFDVAATDPHADEWDAAHDDPHHNPWSMRRTDTVGFGDMDEENGARGPRYGSDENDID